MQEKIPSAEELYGAEKQLVKLLTEKGLKVTTAESITGGLISKLITDVPGASEVFECGICSYSNRIKNGLLGVSTETLDAYSEYSSECACEMAAGARKLSGADVGISATGIAGPGGGTEEKPVGTVYVGISTENNTKAYELRLGEYGSREGIRKASASYAVYLALEAVREL